MNTNKHESVDTKKLLEGVQVEWKALGEETNILRGRRLTRKELSEVEEYPVFHGGLEPMEYYSQSNRPAQTVMIINVGASAGTVGFCPTEFWSSDGCYAIEHCALLNNRFLYFVLIGLQHFLRSRVRVAGIPTLDASVVEKLQIPIPPLLIQKEIVHILDTFTELTAELTHRKKQYNHYRDQLLSFEEGTTKGTKSTKGSEIEWKTLGEMVIMKTGASVSKDLIAANPGNFPVINSGREPLGYINQWNTENDPIGMTTRGAGVGSVTWQEGKYFRGNLNVSVVHSTV